VDFAELPSLVGPLPKVEDIEQRLQLIRHLESGGFVQAALQTYRTIDVEQDGCLTWNNSRIHNFATAVFREHQITPLAEKQLYKVYALFDGGKRMPLDARDCLCLVDALFRATLQDTHALNWPELVDGAANGMESGGDGGGGGAHNEVHLDNAKQQQLPAEVERWMPSDTAHWAVEVLGLPAELGTMLMAEEIHALCS